MSIKKICTERKINDDDINLKIGTTDKNNPSVFYIDFGLYIEPNKSMDNPNESCERLCSSISNCLKKYNFLLTGDKNNGIFDIDIADNRLTYGKKCYLTVHSFHKPKLNFKYNNFNDLFFNIKDGLYDNLLNEVKNFIFDSGFIYSKTKK